MIYKGRFKILKNLVTVCDYDYVLRRIVQNRRQRKANLLICPIASQTLVLALKDQYLFEALQKFDIILPCSEWVKRSINFLYGTNLKFRVYGPNLMLKICKLAVKNKYKIFLYGTTEETVERLKEKLEERYSGISIVGALPSKFKPLTTNERAQLVGQISKSKADILMVGEGSPLQEMLTYNLTSKKPTFKNPIVIITVGASFDFIPEIKPQAPVWMGNAGLEWFYRLITEPGRLWYRYLILGPEYILLIIKQKFLLYSAH